jgi:hypothetical protein
MPKLDEQLSTLQDKLGQLKLRQQRLEERKRAALAERERKAQTRRHLLIGATVMAKVERGELDRELIVSWLDEALTRAGDRELFGLAARIAAAPNSRDV